MEAVKDAKSSQAAKGAHAGGPVRELLCWREYGPVIHSLPGVADIYYGTRLWAFCKLPVCLPSALPIRVSVCRVLSRVSASQT